MTILSPEDYVHISDDSQLKLDKILSSKLDATYLKFGKSDNELIGIQNWASGQNLVSFYNFDGKSIINKQEIMNEDGRTVDGFLIDPASGYLIVCESSGNPYSGIIQLYKKERVSWHKTYSYQTLNIIDEPSIKNGIIAGTEIHDKHGRLLSLYDINYAPKNILTKKLSSAIHNFVWMPKTNHLVAELDDKIVLYNFNHDNIELKEPVVHGITRLSNFHGANNSISSIIATNDNELLLGVHSKNSIIGDKKTKDYIFLTQSLQEDTTQILLQGKPVELSDFNDLSLSPSGKFLMTYMRGSETNCNIYSLKK